MILLQIFDSVQRVGSLDHQAIRGLVDFLNWARPEDTSLPQINRVAHSLLRKIKFPAGHGSSEMFSRALDLRKRDSSTRDFICGGIHGHPPFPRIFHLVLWRSGKNYAFAAYLIFI